MILRKTKLIVYLAITFSFLASLTIFLYLQGIDSRAPVATEQYKDVVVVVSAVQAGKRLTKESVEIHSWPERLVPEGSFAKSEDVVGKVVARDFVPGEPVMAAHLAKNGAVDGLSSLTPPGMRAMTVSVGADAVVNDFLSPNSRVDVLATIQTNKKGGGYVSKSILQNIRVLSVSKDGGGGGFAGKGRASVTLLVTPQEAERLALAESQGVLYLVLRNIADQDPLITPGTTVSSLLGSEPEKPAGRKVASTHSNQGPKEKPGSKPVKRARRKPKVRIEVIRGMDREEMIFDNP